MLKVTDSQGNIRDITKVIKTGEVLPEYKADRHGTEEILSSGKSVSPILSINYEGTRQEAEFTYRETGGGTLTEDIEKAKIEKVKGNTVAWNQFCTLLYSKYMNASSNITISVDGTKCIVTDTNYNGRGRDTIMIYATVLPTIVGHKYICYFDTDIIQGDGLTTPLIEGFVPISEPINIRGNTWCHMFTAAPTLNSRIFFMKYSGYKVVGDSWYFDKPMLFDLTLIYGAGNEPTTVTQFEADYQRWFGKPLTYEEYDAGSLRPVLMNAIKTKGANDAWTNTQTLPVTTLTGKLNGAGSSVTIFPDGMKKAGSVYDEIKIDNGVVKAVKRVGSRAYTSGDENDTSVITDGNTTTFYELANPEKYVLDIHMKEISVINHTDSNGNIRQVLVGN